MSMPLDPARVRNADVPRDETRCKMFLARWVIRPTAIAILLAL